jgi:hypothetical protein
MCSPALLNLINSIWRPGGWWGPADGSSPSQALRRWLLTGPLRRVLLAPRGKATISRMLPRPPLSLAPSILPSPPLSLVHRILPIPPLSPAGRRVWERQGAPQPLLMILGLPCFGGATLLHTLVPSTSPAPSLALATPAPSPSTLLRCVLVRFLAIGVVQQRGKLVSSAGRKLSLGGNSVLVTPSNGSWLSFVGHLQGRGCVHLPTFRTRAA